MWNARRFLRNLFAYSFVMVLLIGFLQALLGGLSAGFTLMFAPVAIAALQEGQTFAVETLEDPSNEQIWRVSFAMAEVYLTFLVMVSALVALGFHDFRSMLGHSNIVLIFFIYGVFTLISLIAIRWSYAWGVKLGLNQQNNHMG
jgi:hypothetical protein